VSALPELPPELAEALLMIGEVEWGATGPQTDQEHVADLRRAIDGTHTHFETAEPTSMHGVYMKGSGTAVCLTGMSPNSPNHARLFAGAWNHLLEIARAAQADKQ
jgi:hypothetical protein